MRVRIVTAAGVVAALGLAGLAATPAWASDLGGQNSYANAQASGGQLTVQAGRTYWTPPAGWSWASEDGSDPPTSATGTTNPNQPYGCTYAADPSATATLGVGGAQPGEWVFPTCAGPGAVDPMPAIWVSDAQPVAATVAVDPVMVGQQALEQLALGSPTIEMAPPSTSAQLVRVATWLWINPVAWQTLTATASAGTVMATATATPTKVVWDMGDGHSLTCDGPGTPYSPSDAGATSDCSYTWPAPGSYTVTATLYWSVSWTAVGAAGGGDLGLQAGPPAEVQVRVTESQAINTPTGGGT